MIKIFCEFMYQDNVKIYVFFSLLLDKYKLDFLLDSLHYTDFSWRPNLTRTVYHN